jgi:tetratricopeptide (TPR) repeat protein
MIVKNEEAYLADCLTNAKPFVDEMIIVDTGSTDRTIEIAKQYGARLFHFPWRDDFAAARNESLRHASGDWILVLDADEILTPGSGELMRQLVQDPEVVAYTVKLICPKEDNGGMVRLGWLPRLFRNRIGVHFQGIIHEQVVPSLMGKGKISLSAMTLDHKGYMKSPEEMHKKALRNIHLLERQVRDNPQDSMAWFHLAETYTTVGRVEEAISGYRKAIHLSVLEELTFSDVIAAVAYQNLGSVLVSQGKTDEGIAAIQKAHTLLPDFASAYIHLGQAYYNKKELKTAIAHLTKAIELADRAETPDLPFQVVPWLAWFYLGSAQAKLGQFSAALESFEKSITLNPDFQDAHWLLGLTALELSLPAMAFESFETVHRLGRDDVGLWVAMGSAKGNLGDLPGAVHAFREALARDQDSAPARFNLCLALRGLGQWNDLLIEGQKLLESGKESADLYRLLVESCQALRLWAEGAVMYEALVARADTLLPKDLVGLATCWYEAGEPEKALGALNQALAVDPRPASWVLQGHCYLKLGNSAAALAAYQRAAEGLPEAAGRSVP